MRQALHIFRKDIRRHWPEILVGLVLLGLFVRLSLRPPEPPRFGMLFPWFRLSLQAIPPLTVVFWIFLSVRLVHGETLVGDRQWWITKPYEWWNLLAAKELFLLVFLNFPLFCVQLYLLRHAGFPVLPNLVGILEIQLQLALILVLPSVTLASVTRGFGQVMIGVVCAILAVWAGSSTMEKIPNNDMSFVSETADTVAPLLVLACVFAAVGWQYARRKTWLSRGLLVGGALSAWTIGAVTPYGKLVERKYPMADHQWVPTASLVTRKAPETKKPPEFLENMPTIPLRFGLKIADIPEKHWVHVAGIRPILESTETGKWDPGWEQGRADFWAPSDDRYLEYSIKRQDYDRLKGHDLRLRMELALTEKEESEPSDFVVKVPEASNDTLGICSWTTKDRSTLSCRKPLRTLQVLATVKPDEFACPGQDHREVFKGEVSRVLTNSSDVEPGLNPIESYQLRFPLKPVFVFVDGKAKARRRSAQLCSGAIVHLAKPDEKDNVRIVLTADHIRVEDIVWRYDFEFDLDED